MQPQEIQEKPDAAAVLEAKAARRPGGWSMRFLYLLLFLAVFGEFVANDKPWICRLDGAWHAPVARELLVKLGVARWPAPLVNLDWRAQRYDWSLWPPIRYAAGTIDMKNSNYISPLAPQQVEHWRFRHWLGADRLGRDTAAGLVAGARTAILVGLVAMSIAGLIGLLLGSLAGFFGDTGLAASRAGLLGGLVGLFLGGFYGFVSRPLAWQQNAAWAALVGLVVATICVLGLAWLAHKTLGRLPWGQKRVTLPADMLVMRLIEIIDAMPGLLLLLAVLAIVSRPSIWIVVVVIGLIGWLGVARFVRAELLRIRSMEYIDAARVAGLSEWRVLWRHALPNALRPVVTALAFGAAAAILLESYLSFLGIGLPPETVTWGGQIQAVRSNINAWWLAIFPGLAIFFTVASLNRLGEALLERQKR
jgi:peptide/nickel transport system permease protein